MFKGVWIGSEANTDNGFLILGESHYGETVESHEVIEEYLRRCRDGGRTHWNRYFDRISESFGYSAGDTVFWDQVYFGNYVEDLCGIHDCKALEMIAANRKQYNDHLFSFVNEHRVKVIVCFSKLVYNNLPDMGLGEMHPTSKEIGMVGTKRKTRVNVDHCEYNSGNVDRKWCHVPLESPLSVYAIRHPSCSAGYDSKKAYKYFAGREDLGKLCAKVTAGLGM